MKNVFALLDMYFDSRVTTPYIVVTAMFPIAARHGIICSARSPDRKLRGKTFVSRLQQCFSTARPRPGTGPWHQLYRAARDSPGIDN